MAKKKVRAVKKSKNYFKKLFLVLFLALAIIANILVFVVVGISISGNAIYSPKDTVNAQNLPDYLSQNYIVKDLPKNALIHLRLYNYQNGIKIYEQTYTIKKGNAQFGEIGKPDAIIYINSNYLAMLNDFCNALKKANENKDIYYELKTNEIGLMIKYSKMLKYRGCFV